MTELKAKTRTETGKRVGALRRGGFLPAVLYGEGVPSQPITISCKDFEKVYKEAGESTLVKLAVDGKPFNVLIHDIAHDPLRGTPLHADFYAVRMDKEIRTKVPVEFFGESPAVKNEGGILVKVVQELEVEALPQDLPHELKVDLTVLNTLGTKLYVSDITPPKGVNIIAHQEEIIALIEAPRSDEELAQLKETPVVEAPAEVKTEQELKRAEKEEKAAADAPVAGKSATTGKEAKE